MARPIYILSHRIGNTKSGYPGGAMSIREMLIPARETDATLLNLFTPGVIYRKQNLPHPIAHPLLIYAELLYQGGDRAAEAAGQIYNTYLKPDFDEA